MRTALTDRFAIDHPVMSAGMARVAQAPLVAAVSEAGGMGCLGGVSYMPEALGDEIGAIRAATDRPFAVNLLVPPALVDDTADQWEPVRQRWGALSAADREKLRGVEPLLTPGAVAQQVEIVLGERPAAVVLTFDVPVWFVAACHERGIAVMALVGSVSRAVQAQAAGADFVIAQGTEGGGHTGYISTMVLVPAVVDAVSVPVLAAGGIVDGRGLAAAICLGAHGAWMGTRFVASVESYGHEHYKQRVVSAHSKDTTLSKAYTGKPLRTFRNRWTDEWTGRESEIAGFPAQYAVAGALVETGYQDGDLERGMMPAGQGVEGVHAVLPAGEIVRTIASEAEAILSRGAEPRVSNESITIDDQGRPEPPVASGEAATLLGFLEYQRATLGWKCRGVDAAGMRTTVAASTMTLGGLLKHMAYVEDHWFSRSLHGNPPAPPWDTVDWGADRDWEWNSAASDTPEQLLALWHAAVAESNDHVAATLAAGGLDTLARRGWPDGRSPTLRWILAHMIEEYARHNGHADLIREVIDGETGE